MFKTIQLIDKKRIEKNLENNTLLDNLHINIIRRNLDDTADLRIGEELDVANIKHYKRLGKITICDEYANKVNKLLQERYKNYNIVGFMKGPRIGIPASCNVYMTIKQ